MLEATALIQGYDVDLNIQQFNFPSGESCVRLVNPPTAEHVYGPLDVQVRMVFEGNHDLINLHLLVDAIRRHYCEFPVRISLEMPYIPYARQDRVCSEGESLSVKVLADMINALNFHKVYVQDAHSDVAPALLKNCVHYPQWQVAQRIRLFMDLKEVVLIAPDHGATKKCSQLAKMLDVPMLQSHKVRDPATGKILSIGLQEQEIPRKQVVIVDDICDAGGTFIGLAKALNSKLQGKNLYLWVTHGLFTKGYAELEQYIDGVFCANIMNTQHQPTNQSWLKQL